MDEVTAFAKELFKAPAFYTALIGLSHALLLYFVPTFPQSILIAADALVTVVASVWTGKTVEAKRQAVKIADLESKLKAFGFRP